MKMYVAEMLCKQLMTSSGKMDCTTDEILGVMMVFKSKAAARKMYGKKVGLSEITMPSSGEIAKGGGKC